MRLILVAASLLIATTAGAQRRLIIRDVTVIAGDASAPRPHQDIIVSGRMVLSISPTGRVTPAAGDTLIDAAGMYAIPGLIDAHVHITGGPLDASRRNLVQALKGGVTGVLDMAGNAQDAAALAGEVEAGKLAGPSIAFPALFAGPAFFTDPRVRGASGTYTPGTAPWAKAIEDSTNIATAVTAARATGATWLKLYAALDSAAISRIIPEAKKQGMRTVAHATTFPGLPSDLVAHGADMLAHSPYLVWQGSPRTTDFPARARGDFRRVAPGNPSITDLLAQMARGNVALNATLFVFDAQRDSIAPMRNAWMNDVTGRAQQAGVRLVAGTDGLINRNDSLPGIHRELELLVTGARLSPQQALTSATVNGAWAMGRTDAGTLTNGKVADILLLAADPLTDIRNTRSLRVVIKDGRVVAR